MSINTNNPGLRFQRGNLKPDQKPRKPSPRVRKTSLKGKLNLQQIKNFFSESKHITSNNYFTKPPQWQATKDPRVLEQHKTTE